MRFKRRMNYRVGIDMTPIIDCVFLLLIFFIIFFDTISNFIERIFCSQFF